MERRDQFETHEWQFHLDAPLNDGGVDDKTGGDVVEL
jgi:hypothetical protein